MMANNQDPILEKKLHNNANEKIRYYVKNIFTSLLYQAKIQAFKKRADVVMTSHVDEAYDLIISKRKETWGKQISKILGGAMLGAFIPGFISALSKGDNLLIVIFMVMGFIGMFLIFLGIKP